MKIRNFSFIIGFLFVLGGGCSPRTPIETPRIAEPIGKTLEETSVAQLKGFGEIPQTPTPEKKFGAHGSVRILAEFPDVPKQVTVLRIKNGVPSDTQIRNITNTLNMPAGVVGADPNGINLTLEWQDDQGLIWSAKAAERRLDFTNTEPLTSLTVAELPDSKTVNDQVSIFLQEHGLVLKKYGPAYIQPDWKAWWLTEKAKGHCMGARTVASIKAISASLAWIDNGLPTLQSGVGCIDPVFPSRIVVRLEARQDGQSILHADGTPYYGATVLFDAAKNKVASGWFIAAIDPDRSDYPALSLEEAQAFFARGGLNGIPNGAVTIETIDFQWLLMQDEDKANTEYLYPALVGEGKIAYVTGISEPYRIVVPLVK